MDTVVSISQTGVVPEHPSCVVPSIRQRLHSLLERQMRFEGGLATKLLLELGQSEVDAGNVRNNNRDNLVSLLKS